MECQLGVRTNHVTITNQRCLTKTKNMYIAIKFYKFRRERKQGEREKTFYFS